MELLSIVGVPSDAHDTCGAAWSPKLVKVSGARPEGGGAVLRARERRHRDRTRRFHARAALAGEWRLVTDESAPAEQIRDFVSHGVRVEVAAHAGV
nr:hypothetical protein OG781_44140 [Streptomyces sp. NBC_00830]